MNDDSPQVSFNLRTKSDSIHSQITADDNETDLCNNDFEIADDLNVREKNRH